MAQPCRVASPARSGHMYVVGKTSKGKFKFLLSGIVQDIPRQVATNTIFQNAMLNSDRQNAYLELQRVLDQIMVAHMRDDTELYKQYTNNQAFKRWLTDTISQQTYSDNP